jgi:hypothetical protein
MMRPAPLSQAGRQTLVYLCLAGSGPVLTGIVVWALATIRDWKDVDPVTKLARYAALTNYIAVALLIIVIALACFVSIRAIKVGRDGIEAQSNGNGSDAATTTLTATVTASTPGTPPPPPPVDAPA